MSAVLYWNPGTEKGPDSGKLSRSRCWHRGSPVAVGGETEDVKRRIAERMPREVA